jgi:hypothetical protein
MHAIILLSCRTDLRNMGRIARFLRHVLPFDPMPAVREMQEVIPKVGQKGSQQKVVARYLPAVPSCLATPEECVCCHNG